MQGPPVPRLGRVRRIGGAIHGGGGRRRRRRGGDDAAGARWADVEAEYLGAHPRAQDGPCDERKKMGSQEQDSISPTYL